MRVRYLFGIATETVERIQAIETPRDTILDKSEWGGQNVRAQVNQIR